jgi:hypothetical protein
MYFHLVSTSPCHSTWCQGFITGKKTTPPVEIEEKDDDKKINPKYEDWQAADQRALGFLLASVTKEILVRVATAKTIEQAWKILEEQLASQTRAHAVNTCMALATSCHDARTHQ